MRLFGERLEIGLGDGLVDNFELDGEAKTTRGARADGDGAADLSAFGVHFLLAGHIVERSTEAGCIAGSKQMLGSRRSRLPGSAHCLRNRQIDAHRTIVGLRMTNTSAYGSHPSREQRLDFHRHTSLQDQIEQIKAYAGRMTAQS